MMMTKYCRIGNEVFVFCGVELFKELTDEEAKKVDKLIESKLEVVKEVLDQEFNVLKDIEVLEFVKDANSKMLQNCKIRTPSSKTRLGSMHMFFYYYQN